jgi:phosphate:Na+ symporter
MDIFSILTLFGGVGMFLYGMNLMGTSLKNLAGGGLEKILSRLTTGKNEMIGRLKGFALGTCVTAIIQSSAATTIMLIGFVNAGIMTLSQTIPVVFGANVGSTATAQILRLGDLGESNIFLKLLKPSSFAPVLIGIGAFCILFSKKKRHHDVAGILVGLGVLFFGMTTMEGVFEPLKSSEKFQQLFVSFGNPAIGILIGLALTALIQSSSAAVGILQALSSTGAVTYASAIPVIIGINIGKCMTILLGSIGANKKAKRVALSYLLFNIIGAIFFVVVIYGCNVVLRFTFWDTVVNRGDIANVHLMFNLIMAIVLLPFSAQMSKLTGMFIKEEEESKTDRILESLDPMLLSTPTTALAQAKRVMFAMVDTIMENYYLSTELLFEYSEKKAATVHENEHFIDKCETALNEYLLQITSKRLHKDQRKMASELLNSVSDFERIGDHCELMAGVAASKVESGTNFSEKGNAELQIIFNAVEKIMDLSFTSFKTDDSTATLRVEILSEMINDLKEAIKEHHVNRLQTGECSVEGGFLLVDILTSLERIGSHCTNIAHHITKRFADEHGFDEMHGHAYSVAVKKTEDYKALYMYYDQMYLKPVRKYDAVPETLDNVPEPEEEPEKVTVKASAEEEKGSSKKKGRHKK